MYNDPFPAFSFDLSWLRKLVEIRIANSMCYSAGTEMAKIGSALVLIATLLGGAGKV